MIDVADLLAHPLALPSMVTGLAMAGVGSLVVARERGSGASFPFFTLCVAVAVWLVGVSLTMRSTTADQALVWARVSYLAIPLLPAAIYHFSIRLLGSAAKTSWTAAALWWVGVSFVLIIQGAGRVLEGVTLYPWGYFPRLTGAGWLLVAFFVGVLATTLGRFVLKLRQPLGESSRRRTWAFLVAFSLGSLALVDFLPAFGLDLFPFGFLGVVSFLVLASRAIWRHRLVDFTPSFASAKVLETMQGAVLVVDREDRVRVANRAAALLLGSSEEELRGTDIAELVETPANIGRTSGTLVRGGVIRDRAMIWRRRDGRRIEVSVSASVLRDEINVPVGVVYVATDISERKRAEQIEYQAYHDALTGLPNRLHLSNRLEEALAFSRPGSRVLAVLFLDLDGFKLINDSLGHSIGDELLKALSLRLQRCLRGGDLVCRFGGDEFVALVELARASDCEIVCRKLLETAAEPFSIEGHDLYVTASIGGAIHPHHGEDAEELLKHADSAMYLAKELGKSSFQLFGHAIDGRARRRLSMESRLRRALERDELELRYQPVYDLVTGGVLGAEALVRWRLDDMILEPHSFIHVAEETRMIGPIGEWVLATACAQAATWQDASRLLTVGVNLSARQLQDLRFSEVLARILEQSGLEPAALELEITESAVMENAPRTINLLAQIKSLGVALAIDDFGTGYSSLSYLQRFPLDLLKIDKSFVGCIGSGIGAGAIIKATLSMANALGLEVTAEGVESHGQLVFLRNNGCHRAQGYLLGRPVTAEALEVQLESQLPAVSA